MHQCVVYYWYTDLVRCDPKWFDVVRCSLMWSDAVQCSN